MCMLRLAEAVMVLGLLDVRQSPRRAKYRSHDPCGGILWLRWSATAALVGIGCLGVPARNRLASICASNACGSFGGFVGWRLLLVLVAFSRARRGLGGGRSAAPQECFWTHLSPRAGACVRW